MACWVLMCGRKQQLDAGPLGQDTQALPGLAGRRSQGRKWETSCTIRWRFFLSASLVLEREGALMTSRGCFWKAGRAHGCFLGPEKQQHPGLLGKDMRVGIAMARVGSACPPQACHKTLRFPVDWPPEALTSQIQELLDLPLPDHPLPMSGAHHRPTICSPLQLPNLPSLFQAHAPLFHTTRPPSLCRHLSYRVWMAGTLVSLAPVVPKPLPYSNLSLSSQFIASPHSCPGM